MRGCRVLALLAVALLAAHGLFAAEVVVLKDGKTITLAKPYTVKGKTAILTLPDKTVLSVPVAEIDKEKTAQARSRPAPAPTAAAAPARPLTPAEAAKVKSQKKAVVSLTDDTVAHPTGAGGEEAKSGGEGGARIEVGSLSVKREKQGYSVTGSLMNVGKAEAIAVTLTVEALGDDGKSIASGFANIAKDVLTPGEKTTFTADISTPAAVASFNYQPRWKEKAPSRLTIAGGTAGENAGAPPPAAEGEGAPAPTPPPQEAPKPQPRPDVAAPPAEVPVGQPAEPGGVYRPQPSSGDQPKLP